MLAFYDSLQGSRKLPKAGWASNVCFMKFRTTKKKYIFINIFGYFWIWLLYWHLVYLVLKVLAWKICNIKLEFAKKVIIQLQITITFHVWFKFLWNRSYSFWKNKQVGTVYANTTSERFWTHCAILSLYQLKSRDNRWGRLFQLRNRSFCHYLNKYEVDRKQTINFLLSCGKSEEKIWISKFRSL